MSHSDFLADQKKYWRQENYPRKAGMYRYYLAPAGIICPDELPDGWGLLEWDGTVVRRRYSIKRTVVCPMLHNPTEGDFHILGSLLRRESFKEGIYNYRGMPTTIMPQTVNGIPVRRKRGEK